MPATKKPRASNDTVKSQMSARKKDVREQREKEKFRLWALLGVFALLVIVAVEWSNDSDDVVVGGSPSPSSASGMGGAARAGGKKNKYARPGASKKKNKYQRPGKGGGGGGGGGGGIGGASGYSVEDPAADHTKEGIARDERGDKAGSIDSFKAAAKYNSGESSPWMNLGVACMRNQRLREAQDAYAKAEKINPKDQTLAENKKALGSWIEHYGLDGDGPGAASANSGGGAKKKKNKYQRPGGGDKKKKKNKYQRPGAKKASGGGSSSAYSLDDPAADHTKAGIESDKKGDKEGCINSFKSAVKFAGAASDHMNLGVAYMRSMRLDEAGNSMEEARTLAPTDAGVLENIKELEKLKNGESAGTGTSTADSGGKKKKNKYQRPGGGDKKKKNKYQRPGGGDKKKASGGGGSSAYSFDDPAAEHTKQAIEFDKKGDKEGCIKSFESAVKYGGTASDYMNLGVAYMRSRDYDKAQVAMDKSNELSPSAEVQENLKALQHSKEVDPIYTKAGAPAGGKKKKKSKYQTTKKKK